MALRGIRVVEMAGLAPAPFCGMILSDFGAKVTRVDKNIGQTTDTLCRGKESIAVDLKHEDGIKVVKTLCQNADVLIEPFRRGVMEKLGLGPSVLLKDNPRLIYARLTGFGQSGYMADRAGHDINYLALSGVLSTLSWGQRPPAPPINMLADFAGGGLTCAMGIMAALLERNRSGRGQVIDANMVEGAAYVSSFVWSSKNIPIWGEQPGTGFLDGGAHFYDNYRTKDGKYMSVGAIEPQFYKQLLKGLGLTEEEAPHFGGDIEQLKSKFSDIFATKTQEEWCAIFDTADACVAPVMSRDEAHAHKHNAERGSFMKTPAGDYEPVPAPRLSRTPASNTPSPNPEVGQHTVEILTRLGYSSQEIQRLLKNNVVGQKVKAHL